MARDKISIHLVKKDKTFGNSYLAFDEATKGEFTVEEYPKRDRHPISETAKYAVHERYGGFLGKTMTLRGAKNIIREQRKIKDVS